MTPEQRVKQAELLAAQLHAGQRYGDEPYVNHLRAVVSFLRAVGAGPTVRAAGWLHDAIEDTDATYGLVTQYAGKRVARCVGLVTDKPGVNRRARHAATYPAIRAAADRGDYGALLVKLADRCANVIAAYAGGRERLARLYEREQADFAACLRRAGDPWAVRALWAFLDSCYATGPHGALYGVVPYITGTGFERGWPESV